MTNPFHLLNKNNYSNDEAQEKHRLDICNKCEHFFIEICKKCGCIMPLKVKLKESSCPLNKW